MKITIKALQQINKKSQKASGKIDMNNNTKKMRKMKRKMLRYLEVYSHSMVNKNAN